MICEYCKHDFNNTSAFNKHLRDAKKCIQIRNGIKVQKSCTFCHKELSTKQRLDTHIKICKYKDNPIQNDFNGIVIKLQKEVESLKEKLKSQPRVHYTEQNVIYILTTPSHKKEGRYILGKAMNLTNRLSVYNKTDEHEVVYYQSCQDEETMSIVEQFVFKRLEDYREQANRERFVLPEGKTIDLFIDVIKKTIG